MSHATCTRGHQVISWLLVVESQIINLTSDLSFRHNLCFRCSNGSCKPISDICVPRAFHWCKERFDPLSFDPCNCFLKIWESIWDSNSQDESSFGSVKVHSLTLFCIPRNMWCDFRASFLALTLASPCLYRKPEVRVAIENVDEHYKEQPNFKVKD